MNDSNPVAKAFAFAAIACFVVMVSAIFFAGSNPEVVVAVVLISGFGGLALTLIGAVFHPWSSDASSSFPHQGKVPAIATIDGPHVVYRIYGANGALLYVGVSNDHERRLKEHARTKAWWPQASSVQVEHYPNRSEAMYREAAVIRFERPVFNIQHK